MVLCHDLGQATTLRDSVEDRGDLAGSMSVSIKAGVSVRMRRYRGSVCVRWCSGGGVRIGMYATEVLRTYKPSTFRVPKWISLGSLLLHALSSCASGGMVVAPFPEHVGKSGSGSDTVHDSV